MLDLLSDVEQIAEGVPDRSRRDGDPIGKGSSLVLGTVLVDTDQGQGGGRQCDRHDEKVAQECHQPPEAACPMRAVASFPFIASLERRRAGYGEDESHGKMETSHDKDNRGSHSILVKEMEGQRDGQYQSVGEVCVHYNLFEWCLCRI